jgi:RNA polymerase sigma-70 factor (ECF subfamily)
MTRTPRLYQSDAELVGALRRREEPAFAALLDRYYGPMLRLAMTQVHNRAHAEEIVQEAWLGVLQGIDRFESRSSLRTWMFHILLNIARTRRHRERRTVPFSALEGDENDAPGPSVDPERFLSHDHPRWPHHWAIPPRSWGPSPEERLLLKETQEVIERAIAVLPEAQRAALVLRDVHGLTSPEAADLLGITEGHLRVLLHRARSKVRRALEEYLGAADQ